MIVKIILLLREFSKVTFYQESSEIVIVFDKTQLVEGIGLVYNRNTFWVTSIFDKLDTLRQTD